jgi:hypothetical protein
MDKEKVDRFFGNLAAYVTARKIDSESGGYYKQMKQDFIDLLEKENNQFEIGKKVYSIEGNCEGKICSLVDDQVWVEWYLEDDLKRVEYTRNNFFQYNQFEPVKRKEIKPKYQVGQKFFHKDTGFRILINKMKKDLSKFFYRVLFYEEKPNGDKIGVWLGEDEIDKDYRELKF